MKRFPLTERLFQCLMSNQYGDFTSLTVCWGLSSLTIFVHIRLRLKLFAIVFSKLIPLHEQ
jgi:hypothetical protein